MNDVMVTFLFASRLTCACAAASSRPRVRSGRESEFERDLGALDRPEGAGAGDVGGGGAGDCSADALAAWGLARRGGSRVAHQVPRCSSSFRCCSCSPLPLASRGPLLLTCLAESSRRRSWRPEARARRSPRRSGPASVAAEPFGRLGDALGARRGLHARRASLQRRLGGRPLHAAASGWGCARSTVRRGAATCSWSAGFSSSSCRCS